MKRTIALVCLLGLLFALSGCAEKEPTAEELVTIFVNTAENHNTLDAPTLRKNIEMLGLQAVSSVPVLNEDFFHIYLKKYTTDNFIEHFFNITNCEAYAETATHTKTIVDTFCKVAGITPTVCHWYNMKACTGTFYSDDKNMYAEPIPKNEVVYGDFYNASGEDRNTQSRTSKQRIERYGDFAILDSLDYEYNQGSYEWRDGKFYDELPSWDLTTRRHLYYKGHFVLPMTSVGDDLYVLDDGREDIPHYGVLVKQETPGGSEYYAFKITYNHQWKSDTEREQIYQDAMKKLQAGEDQAAYDLLVTISTYKDSFEHLKRFKRMLVSGTVKTADGEQPRTYRYTFREDGSVETVSIIMADVAEITYHLDPDGKLTTANAKRTDGLATTDVVYKYSDKYITAEETLHYYDKNGTWQTSVTEDDYVIGRSYIASVLIEKEYKVDFSYSFHIDIPEEIIGVTAGKQKYNFNYQMVYDGTETNLHKMLCFPLIFVQ